MRLLLLLIMAFFPLYASATSTITCHCFQDRTFDHRNTAAADPYFLATTQNSFIATIYGVDKKVLVKARMTGTSDSYLWVVHDLAKRSRRPTEEIARLYAADQKWSTVIDSLKLKTLQVDDQYRKNATNTETLADHIVNRHLSRYFNVSQNDLISWREQGLTRKELILTLLLGNDPLNIYNQVRSGMKTWGELLYEQRLRTGGEISQALATIISRIDS